MAAKSHEIIPVQPRPTPKLPAPAENTTEAPIEVPCEEETVVGEKDLAGIDNKLNELNGGFSFT